MGLLDFLRRKPKPEQRSIHTPVIPYGRRKGVPEVLTSYREVSWLRTVVDVVANGIATGTKWHAYKPLRPSGAYIGKSLPSDMRLRTKALASALETKDLVELPEHEVLRLLRDPNEEYGGIDFLKLFTIHILLAGEAFIHLLRRPDGGIGGLALIPPNAVDATPTPESPVFRVTMNLQTQHLPRADVLHAKDLDPSNPSGRGAGVGLALGDEIDTLEAISRTIKTVFGRGGMPPAVVSVEPPPGDEDETQDRIDDLQKRWEAGHTGPANAGKPAFLPGHVHVAVLGSKLADDQTVGVLDKTEDRIREGFGVPAELVGAETSGDRDKSEAAKYTLADQVLLPRMEFIRDFLRRRLVPLIDEALILEVEDPRPSQQDRVIEAMTAQINPAFEFNELRKSVGYEPLPELAGVRMPLMPGQSLVTPGAQPAQAAQPAAKDAPKPGAPPPAAPLPH